MFSLANLKYVNVRQVAFVQLKNLEKLTLIIFHSIIIISYYLSFYYHHFVSERLSYFHACERSCFTLRKLRSPRVRKSPRFLKGDKFKFKI